jgi:hypothetical protein
MTPFELSVGHELDIERQRFDNEWLFRWHSIRSERHMVDVPDYRGGRITMGGRVYDNQCQSIFWQGLGRYLNGKVHEIFYPPAMRRSSLEGTARILGIFVAAVMQRANSTDQALRGLGTPKTDKALGGSGAHSHANVEILRLKQAHEALLPAETPAGKLRGVGRKLMDAVNLKPSFMGMSIDLKQLFTRQKT